MSCPHMSSCALYPLFSQRAVLEIWKTNYCTSEYERCARYQLACEGQTIPLTLLPNGRHLQVDLAGGGGRK